MKNLNLRKISVICCLLLVNVCMVSSQIKWGVKAGFDVAENKISKDIVNAENRLGFQVGVLSEFTLPILGWGVDASLLYGFKEYKSSDDDVDISNYNYLMLPVNLKKRFSFAGLAGVYLLAGPYAELKLGGGDFDFKEFNTVNDKIKSKGFGAGLNFGVGFNLLSTLDLGMTYRMKLTDNYGDSDLTDFLGFDSKKDRTWNINLTYFF